MYSFNIYSIWSNTNFNNAYVFYFVTILPDNTNMTVIFVNYENLQSMVPRLLRCKYTMLLNCY